MVKYDLNGLSLRHQTIYIINIQYLAFILTFKYFSIFLKFSGFSNFTKFKSLESTQLLLWASWGQVRSRRAPHQVQQFWRLSVTNKQPSKQIRKAYIWSLNFFYPEPTCLILFIVQSKASQFFFTEECSLKRLSLTY